MCLECRRRQRLEGATAKAKAILAGKRFCIRCKKAKDRAEFSPTGAAKAHCRDCARVVLRQWKARREAGMTHFTCSRCEQSKPREEFSPNDGRYRDYRCKQCNAARAAMGRFTDRTRFVGARGIAKRRSLAWEITFEQYIELRAKPCSYCGSALPDTGVGLDRLRLDGGYTMDNVTPCCGVCNLVRGSIFTPDEMKLLGPVVAQIKAARAAAGVPDHDFSRGWGRPRKYQHSSV